MLLSLVLAVAVSQPFSPPPLVPLPAGTEDWPTMPLVQVEDAPPPIPSPVRLETGDELSQLRRRNASLTTQLELVPKLSALSLQIEGFDTSGPGWAKALRVIGYTLVIPAFLFSAPVVSGDSVVAGSASAISGGTTSTTLTPTFNTVGLVLAVTCGVCLALGITFGVVGWISKTLELDGLIEQRTALERELSRRGQL